MFADTHFGLCFNSRILKSLRNEILSLDEKIDFILIADDICSGKMFMNDKS